MPKPIFRPGAVLAAALTTLALALAFATSPAEAAHCCEDWDDPFICEIELVAPDHVTASSEDGEAWTIRLLPGQEVRVDVEAVDQHDREFPGDELRYQFVGDDCRRLLEVEIPTREYFLVRAGENTGTCELDFWVPGNRNLDQEIHVVVERRSPRGHSELTHEKLVAGRLYEAILGRNASREEIQNLSRDVERGATREWVQGAVRSQEFLRQLASQGTGDLLRSLYEGLLDREPEPSAVQHYTPMLQSRQYTEVIMNILDSPEFRESLDEELDEHH